MLTELDAAASEALYAQAYKPIIQNVTGNK